MPEERRYFGACPDDAEVCGGFLFREMSGGHKTVRDQKSNST
jgi:hypothetical protein